MQLNKFFIIFIPFNSNMLVNRVIIYNPTHQVMKPTNIPIFFIIYKLCQSLHPGFPGTSHFCSSRGCHSTLRRIKEEWGPCRLFLEFDFRKCFTRLIQILKEEIDDPKFFLLSSFEQESVCNYIFYSCNIIHNYSM